MPRKPETLFLIDGSHYDRLRSVFGGAFDLIALAALANGGKPVSQAIYYRDTRDRAEASRQAPFFAWLQNNNFDVKGRVHAAGEPRQRYGTNLVELAIDAILLCSPSDHIILMAGDATLAPVLDALRDSGVEITLISTCDAPNTIAPASSLVDAADQFIDLASVMDELALPGSKR